MNIRAFGNTDIGRKRPRNEDAFWNAPEHRIFAVADGLGGLSAGDRASALAISTLKSAQINASKAEKTIVFEKVFNEANEAIRKLGAEDPERGSGTTLTLARLGDGEFWVGHIGDSSAFLFTDSGWQKLTTDHTVAEELRETHPNRPVPPILEHSLNRCLGQPGDPAPDIIHARANPGDCLLLCTDGVTLAIEPEEIREWIREASDPEMVVQKILTLARRRGGADNATAIAIYIDD